MLSRSAKERFAALPAATPRRGGGPLRSTTSSSTREPPDRFVIFPRTTRTHPPVGLVARAREGGRNETWPAKLLHTAGQIKRMQSLEVSPRPILAHGDHIGRSMGAGRAINDRCGGNSYL